MFDISLIEPGLYQGDHPRQINAGKTLPGDIDVVVNVASEVPPEGYHGHLRGLLYAPTHDGHFPGLAWLAAIVDYITACRKESLNVYVHCLAGMSRSTLVVAAYLMREDRMTAVDAVRAVAAARPKINPAKCYVEALEAYQKHLGIG